MKRGRASARAETTLLGGAAITLLGAACGGILLFVNEVLAARLLGLETYGLFALALTMAKIGEKVAVFGLHVSALHFIPVERARCDFAAARGSVLTTVLVTAAVGVSLALILYTVAPWVARVWFAADRVLPLIRISCLAIPLLAVAEILGNIARAFGYPQHYVYARNLAPQATFAVLLCIGFALEWSAVGVAWAFVAAAAAATITGLGCALHGADRELFDVVARWRVAEHVRYALPVLANSVLYVLIGWTDILMLGVFAQPSDVAIYRACTQIVIAFDMLSAAFNAATANRFAVAGSAGANSELRTLYRTAFRWQLSLALCALVVILTNDAGILGLLGAEFTRGVPPLLVLAPAAALHCCFGTAGFLMVMTGRQRLETRNAAAAAGANVILNLWLVPCYGVLGAALGTAASLLLLNGLRLAQLRRLLGPLGVAARSARMIGAAGTLALLLHVLLPDSSGIAILLSRVLLIGMLCSLCMLLIGLERDERHQIGNLLRQRKPRR